jgi:dienelactone hydrolase
MRTSAAISLFLCALAPFASASDIATSTVDYSDGAVKLRGFVARPGTVDAKTPGILVVPEWWGLNDYAQRRAMELAGLGYIAFAVDMYGDGKTTTTAAEAGALAGPLLKDRDSMRARAHAALEQLRKQDNVDTDRLGAIGFCFGGCVALELARAGEPLVGVVSFHGSLATPKPAAAETLKARVLVLHGGADPLVPTKDVAAFMDEMNTAKAQWRMEVYGGALHAFTNPAANARDQGLGYDADAEVRSMAAMRKFFTDAFALRRR